MNSASPASFALVRTMLDLRFRQVTLASREWLTDEYVRVRLIGDDLAGFASLGADDHCRVFFPDGPVDSVDELRAAPSREYTPLEWGEDWLDIEFAVHGTDGIAAPWAANAPIGAPAGVGGPRGSLVIEGTPDAWFLAGDETAVPAMRRFAAGMPADAVGRIIVEVPDVARELPIVAPAGVTLEFVHRGDALAGEALAGRLNDIDADERPTGSVFGFIAAEQAIVRPGRALLLDRWALANDQIIVKGYWKRNEAEYHAPH